MIKEILNKGFNILVIGDIILDQYITGRVERISSEADVPVFIKEQETYNLGGAANVAANIYGLGSTPILIGVVGNDEHGDKLKTLAEEQGISFDHTIFSKQYISVKKTRFHEGFKHLFRMDQNIDQQNLSEHVPDILFNMDLALNSNLVSGIILQDYGLGAINPMVIKHAIKKAKELHIPIFVDPKYDHYQEYKDVDVLKPNKAEFERICIEKNIETKDLQHAVLKLHNILKPKELIVTLGASGMIHTDGADTDHAPTQKVKLADVCGAGDAVISIIALAKIAQYSTKKACGLANIAAGKVCESFGVYALNTTDFC